MRKTTWAVLAVYCVGTIYIRSHHGDAWMLAWLFGIPALIVGGAHLIDRLTARRKRRPRSIPQGLPKNNLGPPK